MTDQTDTTPSTDPRLDAICEGHDVDPRRRGYIARAIELGAPDAVLATLRDAIRACKDATIVLPPLRYESLSRGRGWARKGKGGSATWGERERDGYRVGPGRWTVGATDGFSRKDSCEWDVEHVQVGAETWTIAD